ncbi:UNVERIFIED_CONTAM: hypothetical protein H355_016199 [Colinus virginianus]|nr:hypothetical protein H355_016199 [Colinus virginianus]
MSLIQSLTWHFCFSLGVSSESSDLSTAESMSTVSPGNSKQVTTVAATSSKVQETTPASTLSTTVTSPATTQGAGTSTKHGSTSAPSTPLPSKTTTHGVSTSSPQGSPSTTPTLTHSSTQITDTTFGPEDPSHVSAVAAHQVSTSTSSAVPAATSAATSSATQQRTSSPDSAGSLVTSPTASPVSTQATTLSATSGGLVPAVITSPRVADDVSPNSDQLNSTVASSKVPVSDLQVVVEDHSASSTPVTSHPHHSPTSSGQRSECVTPHSGSLSSTSRKTPESTPSSSTRRASDATTVTTPKAAYTSQGDRSVTHKPEVTTRSPSSALPPAPTLGDQTESKRPDQPHLNVSLQNELICKEQIREMWPIINLKEGKTCDDWKNASANESFFEFFCSGRRHAFDSKRDRCTVTLASFNPHRWAVHAVVHRLLDPEAVFEELKEKRNELEKLGITNVTYLNQEMEEEVKDQFSTPLIITIITLAGSLLLVTAIYGCCHQRFSQKKSQQRLTEELQTMENGYHDNPTLEVMETGSEMQEKKVNLNGELGDSWIVPLDTIMKEDLEEEDTHL